MPPITASDSQKAWSLNVGIVVNGEFLTTNRVTSPRRTGNLTRQDLTNTIKEENPKRPTTTSLKCSLMWAWISAGMQSHDFKTVARRLSKAVAEALS